MRKIKFGINYAAVWLLLGILFILPIFILIFICERSFEAIFIKNKKPNEVSECQELEPSLES